MYILLGKKICLKEPTIVAHTVVCTRFYYCTGAFVVVVVEFTTTYAISAYHH